MKIRDRSVFCLMQVLMSAFVLWDRLDQRHTDSGGLTLLLWTLCAQPECGDADEVSAPVLFSSSAPSASCRQPPCRGPEGGFLTSHLKMCLTISSLERRPLLSSSERMKSRSGWRSEASPLSPTLRRRAGMWDATSWSDSKVNFTSVSSCFLCSCASTVRGMERKHRLQRLQSRWGAACWDIIAFIQSEFTQDSLQKLWNSSNHSLHYENCLCFQHLCMCAGSSLPVHVCVCVTTLSMNLFVLLSLQPV